MKQKKKKILHIITRLERGGPSDELIYLLQGDINKFYEQKLITGFSNAEIEIPPSVKSMIIRSNYLVRDPSPLRDISALFELIYFIKREKPYIVHTHTSKAGFIGRLAAYICGVEKILYSPHGHIFYGYFNPLKTMMFAQIERLASLFTDFIVVHTKDEEDVFKSIGCKTNYYVVTRGATMVNKVRSKNRCKVKVKINGKPIIGTCARLEPVKGISYLINAFPKILQKFPDAALVIVGDGSQKKYLEKIAGEGVIFTGWQDNPEDYIKQFDVFVVPSLNEAWGATIIEAGRFGIPIVATKVGGIPLFAGDSVLLINPKDSDEIADAVLRILTDENLRKHLSRKSRKLSEKYTAERMVREYLELYNLCSS